MVSKSDFTSTAVARREHANNVCSSLLQDFILLQEFSPPPPISIWPILMKWGKLGRPTIGGGGEIPNKILSDNLNNLGI